MTRKTSPGVPDEVVALDALASVVQRLAVLLAAGVAPHSAWRYVAEQADENSSWLQRVVSEVESGHDIAEAIVSRLGSEADQQDGALRGLAAAWSVATDAGTSLAPSLKLFAGSLRALAQTQRDIAVALAAPAATARMMTVLPAIGVLFGLGFGFDMVGVLFTTFAGLGCLCLGITLMFFAWLWSRRLIRSARPRTLTPGLRLDLLAIAVSGGGPLQVAVQSVARACKRFGVAEEGVDDTVTAIVALSARAGVPAAGLLQSEAEQQRRLARTAGERAAATLSVTLMLPLGLCILPAFMLLSVAPLVTAVISSTVSAF